MPVDSLTIRITEFIVFCMPFAKLLAVLAAIGLLATYLFKARSKRRWLNVCMRVVGSAMFLLITLGGLLLIFMAATLSRPRVFVSPDAQHIAEYDYSAGFLGRDATSVMVRRKWSIFPDEAYGYMGPSDWSRTEVRWVDNSQLLIRYYGDSEDRYQVCNAHAAGVAVTCVRIEQH